MLDAQPFVDVPDLDAHEQCRLEATTHGNPVESLLQGLPDLQLGYDLSTFAFRSLSCFYCQDWSWFGRLVCIFLVDIQVIGEERPPSTSRLLLKIWGFCVKRLPLSLGSPPSLPSYLPPSGGGLGEVCCGLWFRVGVFMGHPPRAIGLGILCFCCGLI